MESRIKELSARVEKLSQELVSMANENARLRRLLQSAEKMIKDLSNGKSSRNGFNGLRELSQQVDKLKQERKIIKEKLGKMALNLEKLHQK